jgi:Cu2+-exporting ATPase
MSATLDLSHFVRHMDGDIARMDFAVEGIACGGCMAKIERTLQAVPNVTRARVNLANRRLAVEWKEGAIDPRRVIDRLAELGYRAYPFDVARAEDDSAQETKLLLRCLAVAAFAAMNIMLLSVSVWSGNVSDMTAEQRDFFHWVSALIALPAAAYAGRPFYRSALRALAARRLNMDVPITLGIVLALGMSVVETFNRAEHAYFDSVLMLLAFLLAGRFLDRNMRRRTQAAASNLAALKAETAVKFVAPEEICEVPISAIRPGDIVLVHAGERVCVDGVVVVGRSEVDQSLVTGETAPAAIGKGSQVYAGTLNLTGTLQVRVEAARGTLLDEVMRLLERAIEGRSRYVRLADRAARLYAPVVHLAALVTLFGWMAMGATWHDAIVTAIAVLIITCPCALGLAVPAVQVAASGALFRSGVLLNAGDAIERLGDADVVVFDKTGTLTLPEPVVVNAGQIPPDVLALAGRLALASRHPLAAAVAQAAGARIPIDGTIEEPGQGVRAVIDGVETRLGKPEFCGAEREARVCVTADAEASMIAFVHGTQRHVFAVRQALRADAYAAIDRLRALGLAIEILSGDREPAVARVALALAVVSYRAGMTPADKIARIAELRREGRSVLMVGDGLNDAPALAAADVSLSPVTAVHLTQAAADAVFLGDRLAPAVAALEISRCAKHIMRENLWLALVYNAVAVPIAVLGFATPLIAALAMSGSSLLVTANALRARAAVVEKA